MPVFDRDTDQHREVGLSEALLNVHHLDLAADPLETIALLRLLATVLDAAAGPATTEWDTA